MFVKPIDYRCGIIYTDQNGKQRIQFKADEAVTLGEATKGRNYSVDTLAGVTSDGKVVVWEGRHRAIGASQGANIGPDLGGVPGKPSWLDYEYDGTANEISAGFIPVKTLTLDHTEPDVSAAEARQKRRDRYGFS